MYNNEAVQYATLSEKTGNRDEKAAQMLRGDATGTLFVMMLQYRVMRTAPYVQQ